MPEQLFDPSFRYYDSSGCKCSQIPFVETEIKKLRKYVIPDVGKLIRAYNGIHNMYASIISMTESALYIKEDRVSEIQNEISDNESSNISDILSCIRQLHLCLDAKEIKLDRLEEIDKNYHDDYDN